MYEEGVSSLPNFKALEYYMGDNATRFRFRLPSVRGEGEQAIWGEGMLQQLQDPLLTQSKANHF